MKFLIVERQNGGCDYTIGCGVRVTEVEAESMPALVERLRDEATGAAYDGVAVGWLDDEEDRRASVTIYPIDAPLAVPLDEWRAEKANRDREAKAKAAEEQERATLARLQQKYGKPE